MELRDIVKGLALLFMRNGLAADEVGGDDGCQGVNGTTLVQCQRLYGGARYRDLPICQSSSNLTVATCISQPDSTSLDIPPCDLDVSGSKYPEAYLKCISEHSGVSFKIECNHCRCTCNGYAMCTKMACLGPSLH
ncbi:hypothetical protein GGI16_002892 [Coemansia sp. S142-1]|nr:hypothetical protein LPJ71_001856 [Coemansia sp. S17]KAJ2103806.1 hypothetical protein GGI16_002892 [Coemansia sp. S142-1]